MPTDTASPTDAADSASPLGRDQIAMIAKGVSAIVASRDARLRPSLMRAVGADIAPDGREVTVWLARRSGARVLDDLAARGQIAVVFSEPATHRTVQLKASRVQLRPAHADDRPVLSRYLESMVHEVGLVGYGRRYVQAMLAHQLDDLVAVSFRPEHAFDQTPGPHAGQAMGGAA